MKIKYIVDNPYGDKFTLTDARDGVHHEIRETYVKDLMDNHSDECFFSARASVNLRSVPQHEIFPDTISELNKLTVIA